MTKYEVWEPRNPETFSRPVGEALDELNGTAYERIIDSLPEVQTAENQVQYAVFADSELIEKPDEALLVFNAFAQPLDKERPLGVSNLLRGKFLQKVLEKAGVKDSKGDTLPVIMFAAPHKNHRMEFTRLERELLATGNLHPLAMRHLEAVPFIGKAAFVGHSQGANEALDLQSIHPNLIDYVGTGAADPMAAERSVPDLIKRQLSSNPGPDYRESGYQAILRTHQLDEFAEKSERFTERVKRDIAGVADKVAAPNVMILRGLASPNFKNALRGASRPMYPTTPSVVVGRGQNSLVSGAEVDAIIEEVREINGEDSVQLVIIGGRGHGWAEDARLFSEFTLKVLAGTELAPSVIE